jgi:asparagine synthetase B (glutamine-hydrolysing)
VVEISSLELGVTNLLLVLAHERLSIVGVDSGAQPITNADDTIALAVNGEIYNHRVIRKSLKTTYHFKTHSDCEVIIPLVGILNGPGRKRD